MRTSEELQEWSEEVVVQVVEKLAQRDISSSQAIFVLERVSLGALCMAISLLVKKGKDMHETILDESSNMCVALMNSKKTIQELVGGIEG